MLTEICDQGVWQAPLEVVIHLTEVDNSTWFNKVLNPNGMMSDVRLDIRSQEHLKARKNKCQLSIDVSHIVGSGARATSAISLQVNLSAIFVI